MRPERGPVTGAAEESRGALEPHTGPWVTPSLGRAPGCFPSGFQSPSCISASHLHSFSLMPSFSLSPFSFILDSEQR